MTETPEEDADTDTPFWSAEVLREFSPHPYQSLNSDGEILSVNDAWLDILGYDREEVEGRWFGAFLANGSVDVFESRFPEFKSAGRVSNVEFEMQSADGEIIVVSFDGRIQYDDDGAFVRTHCQFSEITERKERERELDETNTVLRTLVENMPMGVLVEDANRDILTVNERLLDVFEAPLTTDDLIGRDCDAAAENLKELFADPEEFLNGIDRRIANRERVLNEELPLADGRILERDYIPYTLPDGEAFLWLYRDITERKERERELERRAAYLEQSSDVISVMDRQGEVKYQSAATERVTNFSPADVIGDSGFEHVHPDDLEQFEEEFLPFVSQPNTEVQAELRVQTKDGDWRWIEVRGVNKLDDPVIDGLLFSSRDITERKEREEALQRERDRLDQFASVVSHDLRNPLNVAQGRIRLAQEECETEHLDAAAKGVNRSLDLIDDMLELARAGQEVSETEPVAVATLADVCWNTVETADAEIRVDLESTVRADRSRLHQLVENLFRNAIEHGGEDVTIKIGALPEGFYVEDDGEGIPAENRESVFAAGYSTDSEGTGFGLAMVKRIAQAMDWEVTVTASADGGARFEFRNVVVPEKSEG